METTTTTPDRLPMHDAEAHAYDTRDQDAQEAQQEYTQRLTQYAIAHGIGGLTLSQLALVDVQLGRSVATLPATLDLDAARLDAHLHTLRLRVQLRMADKRAQLTRLAAMLAEDTQTAQAGDRLTTGQQDSQGEVSDADRATQLLRAALILIMGQDGNGNGGRGARLIPRPPTQPPQGSTLQNPGAPGAPTRGRF